MIAKCFLSLGYNSLNSFGVLAGHSVAQKVNTPSRIANNMAEFQVSSK
jgi:hypothetical protein